ncbi:MAG: Fe-S cluster assembly protein SufD [Rhodothermales bacterium]
MTPLIDTEKPLVDRFVSAFEQDNNLLVNGSDTPLHTVRRQAIDRFATLGFPSRKAEAWKYTNIGKILKREYTIPFHPSKADISPQEVEPLMIPGLDAHVVVFVNGCFSETLSFPGDLPEGVLVTSLANACTTHADLVHAHFAQYADYREEVFTALNTAFTQDGAFVYVPKNTAVEKPVHIINLVTTGEDLLLQPRHLFVIESNSHLKLIQTSRTVSQKKTLANSVTEVYVGSRAFVDLYDIQDEHEHGSRVATVQAYQQESSVFRNSTFTLGGEMIRNNVNVLPDAEHCESHLYGLFLGKGSMHIDNHTLVDHARPQCFSNELYKGILDDQSTGVFNGKVLVRLDAQQTNAYQSNKSIALTDEARMFSKPELEIYADDVQCSHGATTGQLDREALFYLRSRGLSMKQARALMLIAFARDVLDHVTIEPLRTMLDALISERFHQ